jgi:predicted nucleotidyltransferase
VNNMNGFAAALELAQSIKDIPTLEAIILFGSAATGEMHKKSDIDLLLLFDADHNPETGDEGKLIFRRAVEIERNYKLENPFSFVFVNLGEDIDADFLWEVVRDGSVLYYRPESVLGREGYLEPVLLIAYSLNGIPQKDRMHLNRMLYGYRSKKVHMGKEYVSEKEGLIPRYGKKLGRATFLISGREGDEVLRLLDEKNVLYTVTKVWSTKTRAKMIDIKELKRRRFQFLHALYDTTGGDTWNLNYTVYHIGGELGFDDDLTEKIARYLHDEGLLEILSKDRTIKITHRGVREVEKALSSPDTPTEHFPPYNIIVVGQMTNSQIQQASPGALQEVTISEEYYKIVEEDLQLLKKYINQLNLTPEQESDLQAEIQTVEAQMRFSKPKKLIIAAAFDSIKRILEGATISAIGGAIAHLVLNALHF